jgi:methyltransferase (TIGR00027 family)
MTPSAAAMNYLPRTSTAVQALRDVSGTAFWIAYCRALERRQRAPLFDDPWARELAGERGRDIVERMPGAKQHSWVFAIRTAVLDRLISEQVHDRGVDVVINLAAGFDTRAFRLALPSTLRWFDIDKPEITQHKCQVLRRAGAHCRWEAIALDFADAPKRRALLTELGEQGHKALVISEGLVVYLRQSEVAGLARDLHAVPSLHSWIFDLPSAASLRHMQLIWGKTMRSVDASFRFGPPEGAAFFAPYGWQQAEAVSMFEEAVRLQRAPALDRAVMRAMRWIAPERHAQLTQSGVFRLKRRSEIQQQTTIQQGRTP